MLQNEKCPHQQSKSFTSPIDHQPEENFNHFWLNPQSGAKQQEVLLSRISMTTVENPYQEDRKRAYYVSCDEIILKWHCSACSPHITHGTRKIFGSEAIQLKTMIPSGDALLPRYLLFHHYKIEINL